MATRKEPIDIAYNEPQQKAVSDAVESNDPLRIARSRRLGAAHDGADLTHFQAQDQAACHRQREHRQELRCPGVPHLRLQEWPLREGASAQLHQKRHGDDLLRVLPRHQGGAGRAGTARFSTPTNWSWSSRSASTPTRRMSWKNCWRTAICPLRNLMKRPLPLWTRTPPL